MADIAQRLARIEERLGIAAGGTAEQKYAEPFSTFASAAAAPQATAAAADTFARDRDRGVGERAAMSSTITNILGWAGATALVLAAAYLIRLAIESGWLTPARQVGLAVLGGLILIGVGLAVLVLLTAWGGKLVFHRPGPEPERPVPCRCARPRLAPLWPAAHPLCPVQPDFDTN